MSRIPDLLRRGPTYSFEFFPPRTAEAEARLEQTIEELRHLHPAFVSVTYGAGGSTRERTHDLVVRINRISGMTAMAHLACVGHTRDELEAIVERYRDAGIENVLALGGDPPAGAELPQSDLTFAVELVRLIRGVGDLAVGVAAHPEPHPRSSDVQSDRAHTAAKLAEADFAITQFFFEPHHYFELVDALRSLGVDKPVIPGIMPVTSIASIRRMTELQGSDFPAWLEERLRAVEGDPDAVHKVGMEEATNLCQALLDGGAPGLHFYTLNRSTATREIHANLGLGDSGPRGVRR
jgi:methylenetetrahydrofolate reductase (NADPH)